ncbi:hypothetical protein SEVIR_2G374400v4 [Setaria viridis]|uniref:Uncharacterized protein n=2 Tax=Setaria TaxID=4554 RepID=A0A368Q7I3_SETIT|nr:hypothetical protein SETIT_2G363300v2 [Setaria italica]TKW35467.1 hypothetical protein SEVIR_2G374400v2 [Setaria viridis]
MACSGAGKEMCKKSTLPSRMNSTESLRTRKVRWQAIIPSCRRQIAGWSKRRQWHLAIDRPDQERKPSALAGSLDYDQPARVSGDNGRRGPRCRRLRRASGRGRGGRPSTEAGGLLGGAHGAKPALGQEDANLVG